MSEEEQMVLLLKGHISNLPAEQQAAIFEIRDLIREIAGRSEESNLGLALAIAEIAAEQ